MSKSHKTEPSILKEFLAELASAATSDETDGTSMTKGQALVKSMINEALKGDSKMLANVLKLIEKLDYADDDIPPEDAMTVTDWQAMFAFYGKYKKLIEAEIRKLKKTNPDYWSFDWCKPTLQSAPWYHDLYVKKP